MKKKTALIVGAGGVLGKALAKEFSQANYAVFGIRRHPTRDSDESIDGAQQLYYCDLCDAAAIRNILNEMGSKQTVIDVFIYNAAYMVAKPFLELSIDDFSESWRASVAVAVITAQAVLPGMIRNNNGVMIFSGATGSLRGTSRFAAFSSAKFALRGLTQSLAREYQSQGIHVVHVVIDGLLRGSASVEKFGGSEERSIDPAAVASSYRWLAEQPSSAWTLELDIRPNTERF